MIQEYNRNQGQVVDMRMHPQAWTWRVCVPIATCKHSPHFRQGRRFAGEASAVKSMIYHADSAHMKHEAEAPGPW